MLPQSKRRGRRVLLARGAHFDARHSSDRPVVRQFATSSILKLASRAMISSSTLGRINESMMWPRSSIDLGRHRPNLTRESGRASFPLVRRTSPGINAAANPPLMPEPAQPSSSSLAPNGFRDFDRPLDGNDRAESEITESLPATYGTDLLYVIARDPASLFVYWDLNWKRAFEAAGILPHAIHLRTYRTDGSIGGHAADQSISRSLLR